MSECIHKVQIQDQISNLILLPGRRCSGWEVERLIMVFKKHCGQTQDLQYLQIIVGRLM